MKNFLLLTILICSSGLIAQKQIDDQLIVQLSQEYSIDRIVNKQADDIIDIKRISKKQNLYMIQCANEKATQKLKTQIEKRQQVLFVKNDMESELRYVPNDTRYSEQWNLEIIGTEDVWEITRGGSTFEGKEIVIAVIDEGFELHDDLEDNIWLNTGEIANNNIDDDNNGYIDDYGGLNIETGNDQHTRVDHGTQVASILGAKGDNNKGITGINMDVKVMLISEAKSISEIVEAYEYIIDQRSRFNQSNGEEGAFVVVTNFSAGISNQFGEDWPIWCDLYNDLGEVGVLSVSAVPNSAINVDIEGDLPTTCDSPFLITTTNTTETDDFSTQAGFGNIHVDIGAPGEDVLVTRDTEEYRFGSGTSFSCPHIAGAIGLLYSLPCPQIEDGIFENPDNIAASMKAAIMANVQPITELADKTVSGGRIDLIEATAEVQEICESSVGVIELYVAPNSDFLSIFYETPDFSEYTLDIIDITGRLIHTQKISPPLFGDKRIIINTTPNGIGTDAIAPFLPSGMYVAMLYNDSNVITKKFYQN